MLMEFFKFDLRYQLRQPLLWVTAFVLGLMAFGATTSDAVVVGGAIGNVHRNAPVVVVQLLGAFTVLSMLTVTIFIAGAVLRDTEVGISDMLFATPMRKYQYLVGRFLAGLAACLAMFVVIALGTVIGPMMPWVDAVRVGPVPLHAYLWAFAWLVIPNLVFIGALLMLLAATTRSMMMVYLGVLVFFVLWGVAGVLTRDVSNEWLPVLIDPFGVRAFGRATRYFTSAESNTIVPPVAGYLLANRALWLGVALACFGATLVLFKPQRAGTGRRWWGRKRSSAAVAAPVVQVAPAASVLPAIVPRFGPGTAWQQCWQILRFDAAAVFKSVPFLVMLIFGMANFIGAASQGSKMFGTTIYPVTYMMLETLQGSFSFLLIIVLTFYAGELIFRDRQFKVADVSDALPVPDWAPLVAKSLALAGVVFGFLLVGALTAMCVQLLKGGVPVEPVLYLQALLLDSASFVMLGMLALVLQVLVNNKFIGYLAIVLYMVAQLVLGALHFDHNLYNFAALPQLKYSDMNGYGHFLLGWSWFAVYWGCATLALLVVAQAFWVRGLVLPWRRRVRAAGSRLRGPSGVLLALCLAGFAGTGAWIFHNTNQLNRYQPGNVRMDEQARYEKSYRRYKDLPQPRVTDVRADVDLYPDQRRVIVRGHYRMENKSGAPLAELRLQLNPDVTTRFANLPAHTVVSDDQALGFRVLRLAQPIAAGAQLDLDFTVDVHPEGFTNQGAPDGINLNGTFFNNGAFFPRFGYQPDMELKDRNERRKRGLGEPQRMARLEDEKARANNVFGDTDWINFETTVSTSSNQIAMAPGYLQSTWEKDGRRYFHYKMDRPMVGFFAYLSARWNVKKGEWRGLPIEVYYDARHGYNVDRMITSTQKSLDYFVANFTPYQFRQVRILEFPRYQSFAQSFANTIPYSESIGFIADLRDKNDIDYVFYVTAHEMAHQWWGHQVVGANVQGASMLIESLAQYSALMVMEKEYGRNKLRRFLRFELDAYLRGRGGEVIEELPLYRVENQDYIHYRKGSLVFYRLRDEIGEDAVNRALKRFLQDKGYQQAPYTTSRELLEYLRAEAPQDKHALITDLFEKIVLYDNRVTEASAKKRPDGQWDVTLKLHLAKLEADGKGKETPRAYDEPVEIGIFARAPGAKEADEKVLYLEKRLLRGSDPVLTVTVKDKPFEVGIDPYNKMIDRVPGDNRKEVGNE
ncbi:ABC-type transport system involved in multi-copper enzyme maturation permease subunit [Duganella sp. 3397]|uniref:M1 family aminopeptidase n=1 Tax=Duganella sp. 3397 TaxID=2817732 RepID=UPI00285BED4A|nr:M1 family aminopeptidase [Duganella sp. 3397]MDR7048224.1 ABC-type transport system involved in multi-copper enzyme maturation permease subunit [Duganella sp. 3397]